MQDNVAIKPIEVPSYVTESENSLQIFQIQLKNFRCFSQKIIDVNAPIILIEGDNGSGKTTLLEALHYLCYLKSFRTHTPRELIQFEQSGFFIKILFNQAIAGLTQSHELQVGFEDKKRLVRVDQQTISSYKELLDHYRIITLTENDLALINDGPDIRRSFIDQAIMLHNPSFITTIKELKRIAQLRAHVVAREAHNHDSYMLWTQQLWTISKTIQALRKEMLQKITMHVNQLVAIYFDNQYTIACTYAAKKMETTQTFDDFIQANSNLKQEEVRFGRSLFGAHLDDFTITFQDKRSKLYASRGQQKLIVLLIKIAQIQIFTHHIGPIIFLLDDFMNDFDNNKATKLLNILKGLNSQLIFTSPLKTGFFEQSLLKMGAQLVKLTN